MNVNKTDIITGLKSAYSGREEAKNQAEALSIKYRTNLTDVLEVAGINPAATHVSNMQRREEYHTIARRIKYTEGKFGKPGITIFTQQQTDGRTMEITDKITIQKVIIE